LNDIPKIIRNVKFFLSANVWYILHEGDVTCSRCGVSLKMASVILKEDKFATKCCISFWV